MRTTASAEVMLPLLEAARYEVLPTPSAEQRVLDGAGADVVVAVTVSPSRGLEPTLALTERLAAAGRQVVPHLAARMVRDRVELAEIVQRLLAAGVDSVFVPAGDAASHGAYDGSLSLLRDLSSMGRPFRQVGITGYPESHPHIHDDVTVQAMWDKREHATHIVSNLTFDPARVLSWLGRLRARGVELPVLLGVPGPVHRAKLLAMATTIGVGESTRFLARNAGLFARLTAPGGFTGERFVSSCAAGLQEPAQVAGLHVFTFNQVAETEAWRAGLLRDLTPPPSGLRGLSRRRPRSPGVG